MKTQQKKCEVCKADIEIGSICNNCLYRAIKGMGDIAFIDVFATIKWLKENKSYDEKN